MKFYLKSFLSTALLVAGFVYFDAVATPNVFAQDAPPAEAPASEPAPAEAPAPAPAPASEPVPAPAPAPNPAAVLDMERNAKSKTPEILEKLVFDKRFSRRIPNY